MASAASLSCSQLSGEARHIPLRDSKWKNDGVGEVVITKKKGTNHTYLVQTKDNLVGAHQISIRVSVNGGGRKSITRSDSGMFYEYAGCVQVTVHDNQTMNVTGTMKANGKTYSTYMGHLNYNPPGPTKPTKKTNTVKSSTKKTAADKSLDDLSKKLSKLTK